MVEANDGNPKENSSGVPNTRIKTDSSEEIRLPKEFSTGPPQAASKTQDENLPFDLSSRIGKFRWLVLGRDHLPCILRGDEDYCSARMFESNFIAKYAKYLSPELYSYLVINSFYVTEAEAKLLTEIYIKHCERKYGCEPFTNQDLIVKFSDARELHDFLSCCYNRLLNPDLKEPNRCGFVKIDNEWVVPYTTINEKRYLPLFYFDGETDNLKQKSIKLTVWDQAYLRFCCKVQGIRNELFECETSGVICMDTLKDHFPKETVFEEFWPPMKDNSTLLLHEEESYNIANSAPLKWMKAPHGVPLPPIAPAQLSQGPPTLSLPTAEASMVTNKWPTNTQVQQPTLPQAARPRYTHTMPPSVSSHIRQPTQQVPVSVHNRTTQGHQTWSQPNPATQRLRSQAKKRNMAQMAALNQMDLSSRSPLTPMDTVNLTSSPLSPQRSFPPRGTQLQPPPPKMPTAPQPQQHPQPKTVKGDQNWKQLVPALPSVPTQGSDSPYKMQKALLCGKMVPCINSKPFAYSDLLMTVSDLLETFFPQVPFGKCREVLQNVLKITLFSGNLPQKVVLKENKKCQDLNEVILLVQLKDVMTYMPQLKYILERCGASEASSTKRQRVR